MYHRGIRRFRNAFIIIHVGLCACERVCMPCCTAPGYIYSYKQYKQNPFFVTPGCDCRTIDRRLLACRTIDRVGLLACRTINRVGLLACRTIDHVGLLTCRTINRVGLLACRTTDRVGLLACRTNRHVGLLTHHVRPYFSESEY